MALVDFAVSHLHANDQKKGTKSTRPFLFKP